MPLKLKYNFIYTLILVLFLKPICAQTITVLEKSSNEPIPGIALYNLKKTKSLVTDLNGKVSIDIFENNELIFFRTDIGS